MQSVTVGANGVITVAFGNQIDPAVTAGQGINFTPGLSLNKDISWTCNTKAFPAGVTQSTAPAVPASAVVAKYLPAICR